MCYMFMFPLGVGIFFQLKNQKCYKNRCSENKQEKSHFLWRTKFTINLSVILCMLYPIKQFCWQKLAFLDLSQLIKDLWCQTRIKLRRKGGKSGSDVVTYSRCYSCQQLMGKFILWSTVYRLTSGGLLSLDHFQCVDLCTTIPPLFPLFP